MVPFPETVEYIVVLHVLMGIYGQAPRKVPLGWPGLLRPLLGFGSKFSVTWAMVGIRGPRYFAIYPESVTDRFGMK